MSLLGTIAHERSTPAKGIRPRNVGLIVTAMALAILVALSSLSLPSANTESALAPTSRGLTHQEFVDLNTVALAGLAPAGPAVAHNSFMYWNVGSLESYRPAIAPDRMDDSGDDFLHWNTDSIEYRSVVTNDWALGPR